MLIDARKVDRDRTFEADLCIVGAGAGGITIAREFTGRGFSVMLLESGGFEFEQENQALYRGETTGPFMPGRGTYLLRARSRYFGGSTNCWEGQCRPLDEIDFEERSWVPESGWPFPKSHLEPFYERAASVCQITPFGYDVEKALSPGRPALTVGDGDAIETKLFHLSPPTHFGEVYRKELVEAGNIQVLLHANVVDIVANPNASAVDLVEVQCLTGNRLWVRAAFYVLATGAVENARLLLSSNKLQKPGLGNQNGLVGRYFLEHANWIAGSLCLTRPSDSMSLYEGAAPEPGIGNPAFGALCVKEDVQRRLQFLNSGFLLLRTSEVRGLMEAIGNVAFEIDHFGDEPASPGAPYYAMLYTRTEQTPNPDSRVTLSEELDALGKPRVSLHWQLSDLDTQKIRELVEFLSRELGRNSAGRVSLRVTDQNPWPLRPADHSMGTTRMHNDPKKGVVDPQCRVHGIANLYMGGSSVFPTCGFSNPTFTLVALALRLADHLSEALQAARR
jgi:choline dehydrogenase-like flavoprotein